MCVHILFDLAESPNIASLSIRYGFFHGESFGEVSGIIISLLKVHSESVCGFVIRLRFIFCPFKIHSFGIFLWGFIVNYFGVHDHAKRSVSGLFVVP